jgi:hypothetical protein
LTQLTTARADITVEVLAPTIDKVHLDFGELRLIRYSCPALPHSSSARRKR